MKLHTLPHWTVSRDEHGLRLDRFLAAPGRIGSRGRVLTALTRGKVFVNDAEASVRDAGARLEQGDQVRLWADRPGSARRRTIGAPARQAQKGGLSILYEDESLIVVDKPAGLLAVPLGSRKDAASAYDYVARHLGRRSRRHPFIVHRIDRDTSGLIVFATTERSQQALKGQFGRREPERIYHAVVHGHPAPAAGTWRDRLVWDPRALAQKATTESNPSGVDAISEYRVLETFADASLVEVRLHTGKRNQIRMQAGLRGHALIGERQYISSARGTSSSRDVASVRAHTHEFPRQALHAYRLSFRHPVDGRPLSFVAPLPADLDRLLARLRRV